MNLDDQNKKSQEINFFKIFISDNYLSIFLIAALISGFILPIFFLHSPSGTDVYTHLFNTLRMSESNSLFGFYEILFKEDVVGANYPFGLWFFGSIFMKVTGLEIETVAYVLPLIFFIVSLVIFYVYAESILKIKNSAILSLIFFISMPIIAISIMNLSTSIFVAIFLITIIHLATEKILLKNLVIIGILVFILAFTHTGTFMFLLFFTICYYSLSALIWKKFDLGAYSLIVIQLFAFIFTVWVFPFVQPQYIDKGRMVITTTVKLANFSGLSFIKDMGEILYQNLFVSNNITYAIFWSCMVFVLGKSILYLHKKIKQATHNTFPVDIPIIGPVQNISHGIVMTPFWIGPVQTLLSFVGFFILERRGKCIALSLAFVALFPGSMQTEVGTGALREIYYLFLIIPLSSAAGFNYAMPVLAQKIENVKGKSVILFLVILAIFVPLIVAPIMGTLYYQPTITGTANEKQNLLWLSTIGKSYEGVADYAYRERIDLYANKTTPYIASGYETRQYQKDLRNAYFSSNAEESINDLYSVNINYLIVSDRIHKGFGTNSSVLKIDSNKQANRIFSSDDNFGFYQLIPPPVAYSELNADFVTMKFNETFPQIQNAGAVFLVENGYYKMKIGTQSPEIVYLGSPTQNMLGEGVFTDVFSFSLSGREEPTYATYLVSDIRFSNISYQDNVIEYKAIVTDKDKRENWATLIVRYIFYEKAIKREIIIVNDRLNETGNSRLRLTIANSVFAPAQSFQYQSIEEGIEEHKTRIFYPAQDAINFKDKKITEIFFDEGETGFLIRYTDSAPYPSRLSYQGSTIYDYGGVSISSDYSANTAESVDITQYFAVGDKKTTTKNIDTYLSVELNPYPGGIIPAILMGISNSPKVANVSVANTTIIGSNITTSIPTQDTSILAPTSSDISFILRNVTYNKAVSSRSQLEDQNLVNPIGYMEDMSVNKTILDLKMQTSRIQELKDDVGARGILFEYFIYNIDSMRALQENTMIFGVPYTVSAPFYDFFKEGLREPKLAYIEGIKTHIVLLPVTQPTSTLLRSGDDPETIFNKWKETINTIADVGGVAVFIWNTEDMAMPSYQTHFLDLITFAENKKVTFTTPDKIAQHYLNLQKITTNVTTGLDSVNLVVTNSNLEPVKDISYRITLPPINDTCRYTMKNAIVKEKDLIDKMCVVSVNIDLNQGEVKEFHLEPEEKRAQFNVDLSDIYEGTNALTILDVETGIPVANSTITIDNRNMYESNDIGKIEFPIRRGIHIIKIEKPGYLKIEKQIEVRGLFYKITGTMI